jgi:hypothetical protein
VKDPAMNYDADIEPAARFGFGARTQYGNDIWDENLESKLAEDWRAAGATRPWDEVKPNVRVGWDYGTMDKPKSEDEIH